jgi:hypothetical protein
MMEMFIITREGVYRHEILGLYTDYTTACEVADECARSDKDTYHTYVVSGIVVNQKIDDVEYRVSYKKEIERITP